MHKLLTGAAIAAVLVAGAAPAYAVHRQVVLGSMGDDVLIAPNGPTLVVALDGNDRVRGGSNDVLRGGRGDDRLVDLGRRVRLNGGAGFDVCVIGRGMQATVLRCEVIRRR